MRFEQSPDAAVIVERLGDEGEPLLVIDNAVASPDALIDDAASRAFQSIGRYYPGLRAPADAEFADTLVNAISPLIAEHFEITDTAWTPQCFYSIVTTPPARLAPIQRLPHYDGVEAERIAVLMYLCPPDFGGTSFYRHKSTGFETVTQSRFDQYKKALESDVTKYGLPAAKYIEDGAPIFERIKTVDAKFNRMLIYRGVSLHCSAINNAAPLPTTPRDGRLTVNAFLTPQSAS